MLLQRRKRWPQVCWFMVVVAAWGLVGCNNRAPRVAAPSWSPSSMARAAVEQLDTTGDTQIDQSEVAAAPGLADAFAAIDSDHSGTLSKDEIAARLEIFDRMRSASVFTTLVVKMNGRPLRGAYVKLVPEAFQGDALSPAGGFTGSAGEVSPRSLNKSVMGMEPGFFRVELYQDEAATQPIEVNKQLGVESSEMSRPDGQMAAILDFEAGNSR